MSGITWIPVVNSLYQFCLLESILFLGSLVIFKFKYEEGRMNAFENIIAQYLNSEGFWVKQSVKVEITKEDKRNMNLPSMPRPEIDIVALDVKKNELLLVEVKSYLDSPGVWYEAVAGRDKDYYNKRYKLFNNDKYRKIVTERLFEQYLGQGLINKRTKINYALAAGNIYPGAEPLLKKYFADNGWILFTPSRIKQKIRELSDRGWEDDLVTMTAKLIIR